MIGIKIPDVRSEAGQMFETTNYRVFVIENVGRPGQKVIDVRNDKLQDVRNEKNTDVRYDVIYFYYITLELFTKNHNMTSTSFNISHK